ncbi:MAG: hypothetical protein M3367_12890 [Acidobacteriota bacterium]|nr:hypothetical protein [Acidobacteriota bacterium]
MDDMVQAMQVTQDCIRKVGNDNPMEPDDDLLSLGIDNDLIDRLVNTIATDDEIGLPSLRPKHKINQNIFGISEDSTVDDVFTIVFENGVLDVSNANHILNVKKRKKSRKRL